MRFDDVRMIDGRRMLRGAGCHELGRHRYGEKDPDQREDHRALPPRRIRTSALYTAPADRFVKCLLVRHDRALLISRLHRAKDFTDENSSISGSAAV
jgi:hypothetical protein